MRITSNFPRDFLLSALLFTGGILLVIPETLLTRPNLVAANTTQLIARYQFQAGFVVPGMPADFLRIFLPNAGVALFLIMVPLYWVWIWWLSRGLAAAVGRCMTGTAWLLLFALGHNTFRWWYWLVSTYPLPVVYTMYYPHGWIEVFAFLLAGAVSFDSIRATKAFMRDRGEDPGLHPGEITLSVVGRVWRPYIVIFTLMAVAGIIECWVTPAMVADRLGAAILAGFR